MEDIATAMIVGFEGSKDIAAVEGTPMAEKEVGKIHAGDQRKGPAIVIAETAETAGMMAFLRSSCHEIHVETCMPHCRRLVVSEECHIAEWGERMRGEVGNHMGLSNWWPPALSAPLPPLEVLRNSS